MKNKIKFWLLCIIFISIKENVYAISDDFKYVINTIGIPEYNVYNQQINEDVYYTYNVFCYGTPEEASKNAEQGFKAVNQGKWSSTGGKYIGIGIPGEYYYIGRAYNGSLVSNVCYPVSFFPETIPNYWNYVYMNDALNSWKDTSKYKYIEQLEYMKNTSILYDKLDFQNRVTNPYELVAYGITPLEIGLDRIMLDACATWKTQGVLNVVRKESNGAIRYGIFATAPMAADAKVNSSLICADSYTVTSNENNKKVSIIFGANVSNLTDYAKVSHIKEIKAQLYINGRLVSSISAAKTGRIRKNYILNLSRESANSYPLYIEVKSSLYTEFAVDGLMRDGLSKEVKVDIEKYKSKIENLDVKILSKNESRCYVSDLIKTNETNAANSVGIIQAGNHLALKLESDYSLSDIELTLNGEKKEFKTIYSNNGYIYVDFEIPSDDKYLTIKSWNYLRKEKQNYFDINYEDIGKRIKSPNIITIEVAGEKKSIFIDIIDKYNLNFNYNLSNVLNEKEINSKIELEKW